MEIASRLSRFNEPETLKMAKLGRELRSKGIDVVDLSLGEPDFDTPDHIKEAAIQAIRDNYSHYTPVAGFVELRDAVCLKLQRDNQLEYKCENIVVSTGAKQSIANTVFATVDTDDEVIIPTPYWVSYSEIVKVAGGKVVLINTTLENEYKVTPGQLEAAITDRTRLFMFSSPCNPTGSVYSKEELAALVEVFKKYPHVYIMSDEIYEYINYVGKHESIAQFAEVKERVILINGLSKGFAMTGYRLGYIAANAEVAKACEKIQGQFTSGTNAVAQRAAIVALTSSLDTTYDMIDEFKRRKKRVMELISGVDGLECAEPDGAFYIFPNVTHFLGKRNGDTVIDSPDDLCMYMLDHYHVSTVTGKAFGEPTCIRVSFANSMENIEKGFERIKRALSDLK